MSFSSTVWFDQITCWVCGFLFAMPQSAREDFAARGTSFYCPKGCNISYGKSLAVKKQEELDALRNQMQAQLNEANHAKAVAQKEARKAKLDKRKVEQRIAHGVCPCCNKTFADLSHHMIENHKEFRLVGGKEQKRLTA